MSLPVIPKKSLGQNFLNNNRIVNRIIDASIITKNDVVLEIGPGLGIITEKLLTLAKTVVAVEKDVNLITILTNKFHTEITNGTFLLINDDILKVDLSFIKKKLSNDFIVTANIPYNITGLIIRKLLSEHNQPKRIVLLIQREVAQRILAHDHKESLLSLSVKVYGTPKLITNVSRGNFNPPPRVDSAVISINDISKKHVPTHGFENLFFTIIHAGFAHKRKIVLKNLSDALIASREQLEKIFIQRSLSPTVRAEDLSLDDWLFITKIMYNKNYL